MEKKKDWENITFILLKYTKTIQNIPQNIKKYYIPNTKQRKVRGENFDSTASGFKTFV